MIRRWILVGLYVIVTLPTSADHWWNTPFLLHGSIRPINALTAMLSRGGMASCDTVCTKFVEEDDGYGNNLADP